MNFIGVFLCFLTDFDIMKAVKKIMRVPIWITEKLDRDERRRRRKRERERQIRRQKLIIFWTAAAVLAVGIAAGVTGAVKSRRAAQAAWEAGGAAAAADGAGAASKGAGGKYHHLLAVGDNLIHEHIYQSGQSEWNYDHLYEHVRDLVSAARSVRGKSGMHFCGRPWGDLRLSQLWLSGEIGDALVGAGFDVVLHATNHAMDKGQKPLKRRWPTGGRNTPKSRVLGIHENQKEAEQIATVECKGRTFAMLNYTAQINGKTMTLFRIICWTSWIWKRFPRM